MSEFSYAFATLAPGTLLLLGFSIGCAVCALAVHYLTRRDP